MRTDEQGFFSWTKRRVALPRILSTVRSGHGRHVGEADCSGVTVDVHLDLGANFGHLVAYRDADRDCEYVVLMVGDVVGACDVPVRVVDEEALLIEGARCGRAEMLVAATNVIVGLRQRRLSIADVDRQLCMGGPLFELLCLSGAMSVESAWSEMAAA